MILKKILNHTHTHKFASDASPAQRQAEIEQILEMMAAAGIEAAHHITEDGIELAFANQNDAEAFRLNMMALHGDFGAHIHTQSFDNPKDRDRWMALADRLGFALVIPVEGHIEGNDAVIRFESSEDAAIFRLAMEKAMESSLEDGIAVGRQLQQRMDQIRHDVRPPAGPRVF